MYEGEHEFRLGRHELLPVVNVDGDVAEGGSTVVLNVDIVGREEGDENGDGAGVDELLSVVICPIVLSVNSRKKKKEKKK